MKSFQKNLTVNTKFKYYNFLCMIYVAALLASDTVVYKLFTFHDLTVSVGTLLFPITYLFGDVVAEVYGYQLSRQLIWYALFCELFFCCLVKFGISLPGPLDWHNQNSYKIVLGLMFNVSLAHIISEPIGALVNAYAITKWKILTRGRFFWLRSLGATALGEMIFSIIAPLVVFAAVLPFSQIMHIMGSTYFVKLIFTVISTVPGMILVGVLKKSENLDVYDYKTDFNPFKLDVKWGSNAEAI